MGGLLNLSDNIDLEKLGSLRGEFLYDYLSKLDPHNVFYESYLVLEKAAGELTPIEHGAQLWDDFEKAEEQINVMAKSTLSGIGFVKSVRSFEYALASPPLVFSLRAIIGIEKDIRGRGYGSLRGIENGVFPMIDSSQKEIDPIYIVRAKSFMQVLFDYLDVQQLKGVTLYSSLAGKVKGSDGFTYKGGELTTRIREFWLPDI